MPILWRHLTLVGQFAIAVKCLLVNDIQNYFWIDIATHWTSTGLSIGVVSSLLEIGDGINRVTVKYRIATFVKQPQTVEQLIDITRWLVDVDNNKLALQCLLFQKVDDLFSICRGKT